MEMEGLVTRLVDAREACLTKSNAPPAVEVRDSAFQYAVRNRAGEVIANAENTTRWDKNVK